MRIELPSGTPAELARPDTTAGRGLVIAPDVGGLRPVFDEHCARLAAENAWAVCAPEPWPGLEHLDLEARLGRLRESEDDERVGDLVAAANVLEVEPVAVMGFCMGGMYAMKAAGTGRFDRAVSFYGMIHVPEQWQGPKQADPLDSVAASPDVPVLALIGDRDPWTPAEHVAELDSLAHTTVVRYPDADHGFAHVPDRPAHRPDDAADAWSRAVSFLEIVAAQ